MNNLDHPTTSDQRIELLDALRGLALFGVLIVNLRYFSLFELLTNEARAALTTARWDEVIGAVLAALVDTKAITVFSILFGVSFMMQAQRSAARGEGMGRFVRRMLVLLGIALVHTYVFWWGDILRYYALMGLVLVLVVNWSARRLAWLGVVIVLLPSVFLRPVMPYLLPHVSSAPQASAAALAAFTGPHIVRMWRANLAYDLWTLVSSWSLWFFVLGRLLLGAALGRGGFLQNATGHVRFWIRLLIATLPSGLVLTTFVLLREHHWMGLGGAWWTTEPGRMVNRLVRNVASLSLGMAYIAAFVLLFLRAGWRSWLRLLCPPGRMALTNYLLQTVLAVPLFYGVGFGIGPRFGLPGIIVVGIVLFSGQIFFSHWWLGKFRFGPLEWVWRCLTYGRWLPLKATA